MKKSGSKEQENRKPQKASGSTKPSITRPEIEQASSATLPEERYRTFIENINEGVYELDLQGNFTYFNDAMCKVLGYSREELQWHYFGEFMDEEHAREGLERFTKIYQTGKGFTDHIWEITDREGNRRIIELSANLIINREGKRVGFRGIARDETEKLKALEALRESELAYQCQYEVSRESEKRYRTLLEFVPYPMAVFTLEGKVSYVNPAFSETFGWTLKELEGGRIPYVPEELEEETKESLKKLFEEKIIRRYETKRLTKSGKVLDVIMRGAIFSGNGGEPGGELVILRDITKEKILARTNEALLRISRALPEYPDLEGLLDYISREVKRLLNVEGALVVLHDEVKQELYFQGAAYDDKATEQRAKRIRYPADKTVAGKVIKTGEPVIVHDTSEYPNFYPMVDRQLQFHTRDMLDVPLRSRDRVIGALSALNKREGAFDQTDVELLNLVAGTVALSVENARYAEEIKEAYREVTALNRAKDKVINHLSHELKTPLSVLLASLNILTKRLETLPDDNWKSTMERAERNLERILDIQYEVEDIMQDQEYKTQHLLNMLLDQCADELEALTALEVGEGDLVMRLRNRINDLYGPKETEVLKLAPHQFVHERLKILRPQFSHRQVEIITHLEPVPEVCIPEDVLGKVVDGLIKNAIENTPDEGRVEVIVQKKGAGSQLVVFDCGIGITAEDRRRIFEGFFTTQETMAYSSKRPFDFNAGGKGADLLRMKIFAERYNFKIDMESSRCRFIPKASDICPGRISKCGFCKKKKDCHLSGGTTFSVFFPPAPDAACAIPEKP